MQKPNRKNRKGENQLLNSIIHWIRKKIYNFFWRIAAKPSKASSNDCC